MTQVVVTKVTEADSHLVIRINFLSEGLGELLDYVVLSPSDLSPPRANNRPTFRIMQIWSGLVWFDVTFKTANLVPRALWTVSRDHESHVDFRSFGGLIDTAVYDVPPTVDTGSLLIDTNDFGVAGSQGTIVLELRKTSLP